MNIDKNIGRVLSGGVNKINNVSRSFINAMKNAILPDKNKVRNEISVQRYREGDFEKTQHFVKDGITWEIYEVKQKQNSIPVVPSTAGESHKELIEEGKEMARPEHQSNFELILKEMELDATLKRMKEGN